MTEPETPPRRGRRARALSPEELAALEARATKEPTASLPVVPGVRGAVAAPTADAPVPSLRKFGRRARIIELSEQPAAEALTSEQPVVAAEEASIATIERDHDGVELGELGVSEAPAPKQAPRFEGRVLHRPEGSRGRLLPVILWILIAIALAALIALLLTGVLGSGDASALSAALFDQSAVHLVLEEHAA